MKKKSFAGFRSALIGVLFVIFFALAAAGCGGLKPVPAQSPAEEKSAVPEAPADQEKPVVPEAPAAREEPLEHEYPVAEEQTAAEVTEDQENPDQAESANDDEEDEMSQGSEEYDLFVSQNVEMNNTMSLSSDANVTMDTGITKSFTLDCGGHNLTVSGRISLVDRENKTMTITNARKVDLSGLRFESPSNVSPSPDTDYIIMIKGDDTEIIIPEDIPAGSRKERTKGFYCEAKDTLTAIRYGR